MSDFQYFMTLARGFAPAAPVAQKRFDVIELRRPTPHPGQRDGPGDHFEDEAKEAQESVASRR